MDVVHYCTEMWIKPIVDSRVLIRRSEDKQSTLKKEYGIMVATPKEPTPTYAPQVMRYVAPGLYPAIRGSTPRGVPKKYYSGGIGRHKGTNHGVS